MNTKSVIGVSRFAITKSEWRSIGFIFSKLWLGIGPYTDGHKKIKRECLRKGIIYAALRPFDQQLDAPYLDSKTPNKWRSMSKKTSLWET